MAEGKTMRITVESETSELYAELVKTAKVKDLMEIIKKQWGDSYITVHYGSEHMDCEKPLTDYNVKDGSVVKVIYYADSP